MYDFNILISLYNIRMMPPPYFLLIALSTYMAETTDHAFPWPHLLEEFWSEYIHVLRPNASCWWLLMATSCSCRKIIKHTMFNFCFADIAAGWCTSIYFLYKCLDHMNQLRPTKKSCFSSFYFSKLGRSPGLFEIFFLIFFLIFLRFEVVFFRVSHP